MGPAATIVSKALPGHATGTSADAVEIRRYKLGYDTAASGSGYARLRSVLASEDGIHINGAQDREGILADLRSQIDELLVGAVERAQHMQAA